MTNNRLDGLALMKINRDYCNELSSEEKIRPSFVDTLFRVNRLHPCKPAAWNVIIDDYYYDESTEVQTLGVIRIQL